MQKILLISLIIIGIAVRIYKIDELPAGLFADEIAIAVDAKTIAENGTDQYGKSYPLTFESLSDFKLPGYIYLTVPFYKLLGSRVETVRLPALISSIIAIFLLGYLTKLLFPKTKNIGLFAGAVLALSPFHIHFSRIAYESMVATTWLLAYFIALVKIKNGQSVLWIILASLFLTFGFWTYYAVIFIAPIVSAFIFIFLVKTDRKRSFSYLVILLVWALNFAVSLFQNPILNTRPLNFVYGGLNEGFVLASWLRNFNLEFLFSRGDITTFRHGTGEVGIYLSIFAIPFLFGLWHVVKKFSRRDFSLIFLAVLLVITGLPSALSSATPYGPRFLPMLIPLSLLIALGLEVLVTRRIIAVILVVIVGYQLASFIHVYFIHFVKISLPAFPKPATTVTKIVKNALQNNQKVYFLNDRNCRNWGHDELQLWYFGGLDNSKMISWNNNFHRLRYDSGLSPFGAYDGIDYPELIYDSQLTLYPKDLVTKGIPSKTIVIRCGYLLDLIDRKQEKINQVIYLYEAEKEDPYYVVSERR